MVKAAVAPQPRREQSLQLEIIKIRLDFHGVFVLDCVGR